MRFLRPVFASAFCLLICAAVSAVFPAGFAAGQTPQKTRAAGAGSRPAPSGQSRPGHAGHSFQQCQRRLFRPEQRSRLREARSQSVRGHRSPRRRLWRLARCREQRSRAFRIGKPADDSRARLLERQARPVTNPDWVKFVEGLRAAGLVAYQAAQSKDADKMLDASDQVGTACLNCHDRYRQRPGGPVRSRSAAYGRRTGNFPEPRATVDQSRRSP